MSLTVQRVLALSERWEPLAACTIEAFSLADKNLILERQVTDAQGVANFITLDPGTAGSPPNFGFRAKLSRQSGEAMGMGLSGQVHIQVLSGPPPLPNPDAAAGASTTHCCDDTATATANGILEWTSPE